MKRAPLARGLVFLALLAMPIAEARGENNPDKPIAGSWRKLAVRHFALPTNANLDVLVQDLPQVVRAFRPEGAKIESLSFFDEGANPGMRFKATVHVDLDLGPVTISRDETVGISARAKVQKGHCGYDATREGYELLLDLSQSDEPVSANARALAASICVGAEENGQRDLELTSFMQIGPDYGTRAAGRVTTNLLTKQTDALVAAVRTTAK